MIEKVIQLYSFKELPKKIQQEKIQREREKKTDFFFWDDLNNTLHEIEKNLCISIEEDSYGRIFIRSNKLDFCPRDMVGGRAIAWLYQNILQYMYRTKYEKKEQYSKLFKKVYDTKHKNKIYDFCPPLNIHKKFDAYSLTDIYSDEVFINSLQEFILEMKKK